MNENKNVMMDINKDINLFNFLYYETDFSPYVEWQKTSAIILFEVEVISLHAYVFFHNFKTKEKDYLNETKNNCVHFIILFTFTNC